MPSRPVALRGGTRAVLQAAQVGPCLRFQVLAAWSPGPCRYLKEYPIERYMRDLRVHCILEGTNEVGGPAAPGLAGSAV